MVKRVPFTPRLDTIQGKTIYLVDIQWEGPEAAYSVYEEMQAWCARNMPSVKTGIRGTKGSMFTEVPGLTKEIAERKPGRACSFLFQGLITQRWFGQV
jgi:hypothetical protein